MDKQLLRGKLQLHPTHHIAYNACYGGLQASD